MRALYGFISQSTDFNSSVLCGYLRIRNLTKDYPELTTYFHAEIIGSRYGFLTDKEWGATESDDLTHWSKFSAFRSVRSQLKRPGLTMPDRDRGAIFMRWKERFLVPDHKTKEISGARSAPQSTVLAQVLFADVASPQTSVHHHHSPRSALACSFAGFYYVAVSSPTEQSPPSITAFYFHPQSEPWVVSTLISLNHNHSRTMFSHATASVISSSRCITLLKLRQARLSSADDHTSNVGLQFRATRGRLYVPVMTA